MNKMKKKNKTQLFNEGKRLISEGGLLGGLEMIEEASAAGSVKASGFLAFGFYVGRDGIPRDYVMAEKYLLVFVSQASPNNPDYADAHRFLGCIYGFGEAGKKDIKKALYHFKISAEHGDMIAEYYHGLLTEKRDDRQIKWILMPLILSVISGISWLSFRYGFNQTLGTIISVVITVAIVLVYVYHDKKEWLDIQQEK